MPGIQRGRTAAAGEKHVRWTTDAVIDPAKVESSSDSERTNQNWHLAKTIVK